MSSGQHGQSLDKKQRKGLEEFIEGVDRGRAEIFVGRAIELDLVRARLRKVKARLGKPNAGADLTLVFQGAPGAGKSALLERIAEEWPSETKGEPIAIRVDAGLLTGPTDSLIETASRHMMMHTGRTARKLLEFVKSITVGVPGIASVEISPDSRWPLVRSLSPVILLFDEIQMEFRSSLPAESQENLTKNIKLLHTGSHNLPMFAIFGGLANSADLLRSA